MYRLAIALLLAFVAWGTAGVGAARADTSKADISALRERVRVATGDVDAHFDLAMGLARTPLLEKGWDELQKVRDLDPGYADKVIAKYEPLATSAPDNLEAHFRLAFAYYFKGYVNHDPVYTAKSRKAFETVLKIDPRHVWALNYLSYIVYEGGDLEGALLLAKRASEADPANAVAHFLVGQAELKLGHPFVAAMELGKAMQLRGLAGFGE